MRIRSALMLALGVFALAIPGLATTYNSPDGTLTLSAKSLEVYPNKFVADGKAHIKRIDKVARATFEADATKIVVRISNAPANKNAKGSKSGMTVQDATLSGPVKLVFCQTDANGATTKTTGTADCADYDGATSLAHLVGNVKITSENPALFVEPAVMTGDKATVNLTPNAGPDAFRFRVESTNGVSNISVTPKPKDNNQQ